MKKAYLFFTLIILIALAIEIRGSRRLLLVGRVASEDPSPFSGITSNPPTWWIDVSEHNEQGYTNSQDLTNITDLTGRGGNLIQNFASSQVKYFTNATDGAFWNRSTPVAYVGSNGLQDHNLTNSIGQITNGTLAIRTKGSPHNRVLLQTASAPDRYAILQVAGSIIYFDWGQAGSFRVSRAQPSDYLGKWYNIICRMTGTNVSIWLEGTNWAEAVADQTLTTGNNTLWGMGLQALTNKRALSWNYALSSNEIAALDNWMTTNTP